MADLDHAMNVKMKKIFKTREGRHAKFKLEESSSSSDDVSGLALKTIKSHNQYAYLSKKTKASI